MRGLDRRAPRCVAACSTASPSHPAPPRGRRLRTPLDEVLQGRRSGRRAARESRPDSRRDAAPRAAASLRQSTVHGARPRLRAGDALRHYKERGIASWYGRKFHGQKTSIGETYDMYAMTAAHPTLPLPSYARVTNVATGKSVVVRVNDRGPFLHGRIIDLSYAAAQQGRHRGQGQRRGRGRGDHSGRRWRRWWRPLRWLRWPGRWRRVRAVTVRRTAAGGDQPRCRRASPCSSAPSRTSPMRRTSWRTCRRSSRRRRSSPKVREANGLYRVYVGPYPDRDEARRVADRITSAFGVRHRGRAALNILRNSRPGRRSTPEGVTRSL